MGTRTSRGSRRAAAFLSVVFLAGLLPVASPVAAVTPSSSEFVVTPADLEFILQQIQIAEAHAMREPSPRANGVVVPATRLLGVGPTDILAPNLPWGLRTVDGRNNNLMPGRVAAGAADTLFPRLTVPQWRSDVKLVTQTYPSMVMGGATTYAPADTTIVDASPRKISNLIVDQTLRNPAAVAASGSANPPTVDSAGFGPKSIEILNTPSLGGAPAITSPYNSLFTFFGQFFDHGLDLVGKKSSSFVALPLPADDDLTSGVTGGMPMFLNRTDYPVGSNVQLTSGLNKTTPWVDQNQTYASVASKQVFIREYSAGTGAGAVATGRLLTGPDGGIGTWKQVKAQAAAMLGIALSDADVVNVPLLLTDEYGRYIRGVNGNPQIVLAGGGVREGVRDGVGVSTVGAARTGHAFLDDIAHNASPFGQGGAKTADADTVVGSTTAALAYNTYDNELLEAHYITGDGRGNENIGLTALHTVFHAEHNRLRDDIDSILRQPANATLLAGFTAAGWGYGERLFQAARLVNEMEYQHLVFDTFARRIEPSIHAFAGYDPSVDPNVSAEFANAVYRFGHSMLNEVVARQTADEVDDSLALFTAFLNPTAFMTKNDGSLYSSATAAAGAVARGSVRQTGNEIDEFVTGALRNNLVGVPLDLASLNIARGRDTGTASLNNIRSQLWRQYQASTLIPYESWTDFGRKLRNPASLVNFVAAYGTHPSLTDGSMTSGDLRTAAYKLVNGKNPDGTSLSLPDQSAFTDRVAFMNATGVWARPRDALGFPKLDADGNLVEGTTGTGVDRIDLWVGGLAEKRGTFGGLLGSSFTWIFKSQLERLQDGDRLYYLSRLAGTNLLAQVANNTLADMFVRNTDVTSLPFDLFSSPADQVSLAGAGLAAVGDPYVYEGNLNVVISGTSGPDRIRSGGGNDTIRGFAGNDVLDGDDGSDSIQGGSGDDVLTDSGLVGIDIMRGGSGRDYISSGSGLDVLDGDDGNDFLRADADGPTMNGGPGNDLLFGGVGPDILDGGDQADWVQGGSLNDTLLGDAGAPALGNSFSGAGPDVLIGGDGPDIYIAGGGDDVIGGGDGASRATWADSIIGDTGFDWITYMTGTYSATKPGVTADLRFTAPVPGNPAQATLDVFASGDIEGLSGGPGDDVLYGDDRLTNLNPFGQGDELTTAGRALVDPNNVLLARLSRNTTLDTGLANGIDGNIIMGGAGSDTITGRLGNDLIDGDASLTVRLQTQCGGNGGWVDTTLEALRPLIAAGTLDGSCTADNVRIVREIRAGTPGTDIDTAAFQFARASYHIRSATAQNGGTYYVVEGPEGTDVLWNIETLQFLDGSVPIGNSLTNGLAVPARPELVIAVPGNSAATIKWSLPLLPGGGLISTYQAVARDPLGTIVAGCNAPGLTPATRSCTITRLVAGTTYNIEVTATNNAGTSNVSKPLTVTPGNANAGLPAAPTMRDARSIGGQATVRWNAGNSNGSAITNFTARVWTTSTRAGIPVFTCVAAASPCIVAGPLSPYGFSPYGKYWVDVVATNGVGDSTASPLVEMTTVPTEPENVRVTALSGTGATITWDVPAGTGGAGLTVTGYSVRAVDRAGVATTRTCTPASIPTPPASISCALASMTTGATYDVSVTATNSVGTGPASTPIPVIPTPSPPSAPPQPTAAISDGSVVLSWGGSTSNGGATITSYTATVATVDSPSTVVNSCVVTTIVTTMSCRLTGLQNGTSYQALVYAANSYGTSVPSTARVFVPAGVPGAPARVDATAGNGSVVVSWTAPLLDGGSAVTGYEARVMLGATQVGTTCTTQGATTCSFSNLTNGTAYEAEVRARNAAGTGAWSSRAPFTPQAVAPSAPQTLTVTRNTAVGAGSVSVGWTAPSTTGGAAIQYYTVSAYSAGDVLVVSRRTLGPSVLAMTLTSGDFAGRMGIPVFVSVTATNSAGTGVPTTPFQITPDMLPGTPAGPTFVASVPNTTLTVSWNPPSNGGSAISNYIVRAFSRSSGGSAVGSCANPVGATTSCTITGLKRASTYWVEVAAVNGAGTGASSTRISMVTAQ